MELSLSATKFNMACFETLSEQSYGTVLCQRMPSEVHSNTTVAYSLATTLTFHDMGHICHRVGFQYSLSAFQPNHPSITTTLSALALLTTVSAANPVTTAESTSTRAVYTITTMVPIPNPAAATYKTSSCPTGLGMTSCSPGCMLAPVPGAVAAQGLSSCYPILAPATIYTTITSTSTCSAGMTVKTSQPEFAHESKFERCVTAT
nr:hypothetical protein CFP56_56055 [Quercus suber]